MTDQNPSERRWNLFARELENILAAHKLSMSQLESDVGIPREKARRLIQSLRVPKSLPVLNYEEMKLVEQKLQLSHDDMLRLRAGLLATSIQKTLVYRISQDGALLVAEQAFPIILQTLGEQAQGVVAQDATRWGDGGPLADDEFEAFFDSAWQDIDDADLALQLSYGVNAHTERVEKARSAHTYFEQASQDLEDADDDMRAMRLWQDCHDTTRRGLHAASERLEDLGE